MSSRAFLSRLDAAKIGREGEDTNQPSDISLPTWTTQLGLATSMFARDWLDARPLRAQCAV
jgi:hypothetical protein